MAKATSQNLTPADAAVAASLGATPDLVDTIPDGAGAAVSDSAPVQGQTTPATAPKETFDFPILDKNGDPKGSVVVTRY